ncbi:hypothetical protein VVMO6_00882 [Vibrio vulnificus MO6-24/O]|nr:hypothetical protein VVMO6_00882 [Vibrio vulnificus MO6-24/O]
MAIERLSISPFFCLLIPLFSLDGVGFLSTKSQIYQLPLLLLGV